MVQRESIKWCFWAILCLIGFSANGATKEQKRTHSVLIQVNSNWEELTQEIDYTFSPNTEKELVQLHLLNVIAFLERQHSNDWNDKQRVQREKNIQILKSYCRKGNFPKNNRKDYRLPIFIDEKDVHCAVGFLMKESGHGNMAKDIARNQLFAFVKDIQHEQLISWQRTSGLTFFELALIQPTYGPGIPVCSSPSPIEWYEVNKNDDNIVRFIKDPHDAWIYGISHLDDYGLSQEIKRFSPKTNQWASYGPEINGQILDVVHCDGKMYISAFLPEEFYPHQVLVLKGKVWRKVAHFNGNILSIESFKNELYVLGNFNKANDSISSSLVVIGGRSIKPFQPIGWRYIPFDHMKASKSALFLTSNSIIYKVKNDSINRLANIKYYNYIKHISLDAEADTVFVTSLSIAGYNAYFDNREQSVYVNQMIRGREYPYNALNFTRSNKINGNMLIAGDFKSSTLIPQINDERYLVECPEEQSANWHGEGLLFENDKKFYPILDEGVVVDFVQLQNRLFVLKHDGAVIFANLNSIESAIDQLKKRSNP